MPLPVLAGIPWLAGLIGALFGALFQFFGKYLTKRLAIVAAVVAVLVTITTAFFAAIIAIINGLQIVVPPEIQQITGMVVPSNTPACISAYMTALVARWAYTWNTKVLQYKLF